MIFKKFGLLFILVPLSQNLMQAKIPFTVGGWVPYWKTDDAIKSVKEHTAYFNELSPFSIEIDKNGNLTNPFEKRKPEWDEFFQYCVKNNIQLIPSIFCTDTQTIHNIVSRKFNRRKHISELFEKLKNYPFSGININYERISSEDRDGFLNFIQELSDKLHAKKLQLHLTIEGRTSDKSFHLLRDNDVLSGDSGGSNPAKDLPNAKYKDVLAKYCDKVVVMAYDEWGKAYTYNPHNLHNKYYLSHSSKQWIDQIIRYLKSFIPAKKIILGIPTYGLEFNIKKTNGFVDFKKAGNPTFIRALDLAKEYKQKPRRTSGGELSFTYQLNGEERYVCFLDYIALRDRILQAKRAGLGGIYLFKVDGAQDDKMWPYLKAAMKY